MAFAQAMVALQKSLGVSGCITCRNASREKGAQFLTYWFESALIDQYRQDRIR